MGRIGRIVVAGMPHHVVVRGGGFMDVFRAPVDYAVYLRLLAAQVKLRGLSVWSYCLMSDHAHFIAVPSCKDSLASALRDANATYAHWVNQNYLHSGRVWQGRFASCVVDRQYLWKAIKFVEQNPVRSGLTPRAESYRWSSAPIHCHVEPTSLLPLPPASPEPAIPCWPEWLAEPLPETDAEALRAATRSGRPYGSAWFVKRLEKALKRPLARRTGGWQKGRPRSAARQPAETSAADK